MRCVKSSLLASENKFKEDKKMKTASFYSYLPKRYTTDNVQTERIRRFIYSFKRGDRHAVDFAINIVSECLNKWYGASNQDYVLVCIPAATSAKYNRRFKRFAEEVSKRTGIQNGTAHVNIFDDLITTGATAEEFAAELAAVDANVIGGLFLARTKLMNNL